MPTPRKAIFLLDAIGAAVSAVVHVLVLPAFPGWHGMPLSVLFFFGLVATVLATYSMACYFFRPVAWRPWLRRVAIANLLFCVASVVLMVICWSRLTYLGVAYFTAEALVVLGLARYELTVANRLR